jgi:hypothetical protein
MTADSITKGLPALGESGEPGATAASSQAAKAGARPIMSVATDALPPRGASGATA